MDKIKTFASKYWKHTAIGAGIAIAAGATAVYLRNSDGDDETSVSETTD